ncbi:hypothetical protein CC85DRAFT_325940 [Cutaneotrichosporon oleaginosum]|uniref:Uncharacterized protein n=1 Tax=Cutaneotrichosporon oleaginosum TaxID=879819 RepID=A0A0J0XVC6_9TREE|nr:uncharacterized protein CC85DRAFT_325940 [Cutaneotrichosporon oleaginosum]KLT45020.1 hypothetical protein CC85DRAFT_325940 [Cutaneotrichosporon oleaginosum]TXT09707.1 hypothetical protein COLE_03641 [Cutaneotrichosporon oleaginosum]
MADLPAISLAIGGGKTWDDRELVNAYDAALLEFHIHNPGPGSWLDKATAALAKGQPLPGAADFGTAWYSASKEEEAEAEREEEKEPPKKKAKKTKKKNPYSKAVPVPASPTYQPVSPGGQYDAVEWPPAAAEAEGEEEEDGDEDYDEDRDEWQGYDGHGADEVGQVFPAPAGQWPSGSSVGRDEAIGYALHAQYWAGYWMGIAAAGGAAGANTSGAEGSHAPGISSRSHGKDRSSPNGLRR